MVSAALLSSHEFKVNEVLEGIVTKLTIRVPVASPADFDFKAPGDAGDRSGQKDEALTVVPVQGHRSHVYGLGGLKVVLGCGPGGLGAPFGDRPVLVDLAAVATEDPKVGGLDRFVEDAL